VALRAALVAATLVAAAWPQCRASAQARDCAQLAWMPAFAPSPGVDGAVWSLVVHDDGLGGGPALYAGGSFTAAGGIRANHVARWNGVSWSPLGEGTNSNVHALVVLDECRGAGPELYEGGSFTMAGGAAASRVARWDGASWTPLGGQIEGGPFTPTVLALAAFDDGSGAGPSLHIAGDFKTIDGATVNNIARWNGSSWSPLANGTDGAVSTLAAFDDGSGAGPALYAGGEFIFPSGVAARRVARWNGVEWSALGAGMNGGVAALTVFDDGAGGGAALHAAGLFTSADEQPANRIARWNGTTWTPLGSGLNGAAQAMAVFGAGTAIESSLFVGGSFTMAGGVAVSGVARWNGATWASLGGGTNAIVLALAGLDAAPTPSPALFVGGNFDVSPAGDAYLAKWGCGAMDPLPADLNHDGVVDGADLGILLAQWGSDGTADLDGSGTVDATDMDLLLAAWTAR